MYEQEPDFREPGPKATFNVTVESFDTSTFYQDIIRAAVDRIMGQSWSENALTKKINATVQEKVLERLNLVIEQAVADMLSKPIQKFDTFGHPVGEPLSVEAIVRNGAETYLTEPVDAYGKPTRDSYGDKKTRIQRLVEESVVANLSKEMKKEADAVRTEVVKRAQAAAAAVLAGVKP